MSSESQQKKYATKKSHQNNADIIRYRIFMLKDIKEVIKSMLREQDTVGPGIMSEIRPYSTR